MAKKTKKPETLIEKYDAIQEIGHSIERPWLVKSAFGGMCPDISVIGSDVSLGEDYISVDRAQQAIEWYVTQLGGKVQWD
jgi:hypothetical protein